MRSSNSCGGTEICVDIGVGSLNSISARKAPWRLCFCVTAFDHALVLFNPYHLRAAGDHLVVLHRLERAMHRVLMGRIGDQDHRHRRWFSVSAAVDISVRMALHDRLDGEFLLPQSRW